MPLRASQILLRASSLDALAEVLARALRRQKAPPPGAPRMLVALESNQSCTLLEPGTARVDFGLARLLSESLAGPVLALELDGAALSLKLRRFEAGELRAQLDEPQLSAADPQAGPSPRYRDVEALAWEELRGLRVPPGLRLCDPAALELLDAADFAQPALIARVTSQGVSLSRAAARMPDRGEGADPPVQPDSLFVEVNGASSGALALEVHALATLPATPAEADALAEVEEAQALRLCAQLAADAEGDRVPRPSFAIRASEPERLRTEPLLQAARARRPRLSRMLDPAREPPLSHQGFNALCRAALERELPEARIARAHGLRLELFGASAGVVLRVPLAPAYAAYLRDEPPRRHPATPVIDRAFELLEHPLPLAQWPKETVLRGLLPTLIPERQGWERASGQVAGPVRSGLLCDDGARIAAVDEETLRRLGLSYESALSLALQNLDALSLASPRGLSFLELEFGPVAIADFDDPAGAGRLLSPLSRAMLLALFGGEACLVATPTRDALLACAVDDEAADFLRAEAALRFAEGPFPLDPGLLRLGDTGLEEF